MRRVLRLAYRLSDAAARVVDLVYPVLLLLLAVFAVSALLLILLLTR